MGTRSLTIIKDKNEDLTVMYAQFDGYPTGHGKDLARFLSGKFIVNGYQPEDEEAGNFNGIGCLAAALIAHFKSQHGIGGYYLHKPGTRDCGEEYTYTISEGDEITILRGKFPKKCRSINLKCESGSTVLFDGPVNKFNAESVETAE